MNSESDIPSWYAGQSIFVTGATGFMGKVLVEKLLRCCPNVSTIYIVIRHKKGRNASQRLEDFWNSPVFDKLRDSQNSETILNKLKCLSGDVVHPNLNLDEDVIQELEQKVTVVFHMAANVRFDQPLKSAVLLNTGGTLNVLELACRFKNLKVFVHTSTSYCHCDETRLEEKLYPAPHNPRHILDLAKWMDGDLLKLITPKLLGNSPNTYAYTKCLTEQLVSEYQSKLPVAICRPSIVTAAWKEPLPGWVDNLNGPTGILIGAGKGVIRTMHCNADLIADVVPVDVSVNSLMLIAWKTGSQPKENQADVFNVTVNRKTAKSWGEALAMGRKHFYDYPFSVCLWYPGGNIKSTYLAHAIAVFFLHLIPAYLVDFLMYLTNNKPFLVQTQKKIQNGLSVLQYYTTRPWNFSNEKLHKVAEGLGDRDKAIFYLDEGQIINDDYMKTYILGARKYCVHEEPETIPYARKVLKRLYYLDVLTNVLLICLLAWGLYLLVVNFTSAVNFPGTFPRLNLIPVATTQFLSGVFRAVVHCVFTPVQGMLDTEKSIIPLARLISQLKGSFACYISFLLVRKNTFHIESQRTTWMPVAFETMQELMRCFKGWFYFWAWNCSIVGGYLLFVPLMLLQMFTTKFHRRILDLLVTYWQYYVTTLLFLLKCQVHVTGDPIKSDEISLVISNHRTRVDWNFLWAVMYHAVEGKNRWWYSTKFILKKSIQNIPAAGWVMQMAMYVFINRTWDEDKSVLDNYIAYVDRMDYKHLLILFPEGTDLTPKTIESSNRFAVLNRLPKYEHVLHPRTTGFVYLVDEMRKRNCLDAVYDLTLIYPDDCPQNEEQLFFQGKFPTNVLAHLVRYPVPALPDNKEGLKLFLEQRWLEKEQTMNEFRKTGNFLYHGSALNRDRYLSKAWACFTQLIWLGLSGVMIYFLFAHVIYFWLVTVYTVSLYLIPLLKACLRTIGNRICGKSSKKMKHSVSE